MATLILPRLPQPEDPPELEALELEFSTITLQEKDAIGPTLPPALITPEETPAPQQEPATRLGSPEPSDPPDPLRRLGRLLPAQYDVPPPLGADPSNRAPQGDQISGNISSDAILPKGVKRSTRKQACAAAIQAVQDLLGYYAAFSASITNKQPSLEAKIHRDQLPPPPQNFRELLNHPYKDAFLQAIVLEINILTSKNTWEIQPRSVAIAQNKQIIPLIWVFTYKFDTEGYLLKFKARLCVRGDLQFTERDTFAATLAGKSFRSLMAITAAFDLETLQLNAVNAFINSPIDEEIFCQIPDGYNLPEAQFPGPKSQYVIRLLRALYGLRQSPALWHNHFSTTLESFSLQPITGVNCLFKGKGLILFFYVDDICLLYRPEDKESANHFVSQLVSVYQMRLLGELAWFLNIRITRDRAKRELYLCQDSYISKLRVKFNLQPKPHSTPLPQDDLISATTQASEQEIYAYQQRIGSINFAAVTSRPDIAQASSRLSEFLKNPSPLYLAYANRVIEYLLGTKTLAISFSGLWENPPKQVFLACSDASFGNNPTTRKSYQGLIFSLFGGPIDWAANKQRTVTTSSTKAELLALSTTAKETIWWERLF